MENIELIENAIRYVEENPNYLKEWEKECLISGICYEGIFRECLYRQEHFIVLLSDFLSYYELLNDNEKIITDYVENYFQKDIKILDIASGPKCNLGRALHRRGFTNVTCKDPVADICYEQQGIKVLQEKLTLEDFKAYDLIVGNKSCELAEMLIRQGNKNQIPVIFTICSNPEIHELSINEIPIESEKSFFEELEFIGAKIFKFPGDIGKCHLISNTKLEEGERVKFL